MTDIESEFIARAKLAGADDGVQKWLETAERFRRARLEFGSPVVLYACRIASMMETQPELWAMIGPQFDALADESGDERIVTARDKAKWLAGE